MNERSSSGRWCRTAWPRTRSNAASSNGSAAASATAVSTSRPSRSAFARSVVSMPGETSVQTPDATIPSCIRLSVKYPVPEPISSERAKGPGARPSSFSTLPSTCARPTGPKSTPHFVVVLRRRHVVVAAVDVEDVLGASRARPFRPEARTAASYPTPGAGANSPRKPGADDLLPDGLLADVALPLGCRRSCSDRQPPLTCLVASTVGSTVPFQSLTSGAGRARAGAAVELHVLAHDGLAVGLRAPRARSVPAGMLVATSPSLISSVAGDGRAGDDDERGDRGEDDAAAPAARPCRAAEVAPRGALELGRRAG